MYDLNAGYFRLNQVGELENFVYRGGDSVKDETELGYGLYYESLSEAIKLLYLFCAIPFLLGANGG